MPQGYIKDHVVEQTAVLLFAGHGLATARDWDPATGPQVGGPAPAPRFPGASR